MMPNATLYVKDEDYEMVRRAMKLTRFYDDKSLSKCLVEKAKQIVKRYDSNDESSK